MIPLACCLALAACRRDPPPEPLPKFSELQPKTRLLPPPEDDGSVPLHEAASIVFYRLELPRAVTVSGRVSTYPEVISIWSKLDTTGLDEEVVRLWRANGLRIGFLDAANGDALAPLVARNVNPKAGTRVSSAMATTLQTFPTLTDPPPYELTLPDGEAHQRPAGGRFQFVLNFIPRADGGLDLQLTPQHYFRTPTLLPVPELERDFQGRIFSDLAIDTTLPQNRLLVVTLDRPVRPASQTPSLPAQTQPAATRPAATAPAGEQEAERDEPPVFRLGELLLTGARFGQPIEMVLVIAVPE